MFKSFINKYAYIIYQKVKSKINIVLFLILIFLLVGIVFTTFFRGNSEAENIIAENTSSYRPHETVISGEDVNDENYEQEESIINMFVEYCNNGQVEEAYNMLSSDCKEALYPNQQSFENNYYKNIFTEKRTCNLQAWINDDNYTNKPIKINEEIISPGDLIFVDECSMVVIYQNTENNVLTKIMNVLENEKNISHDILKNCDTELILKNHGSF